MIGGSRQEMESSVFMLVNIPQHVLLVISAELTFPVSAIAKKQTLSMGNECPSIYVQVESAIIGTFTPRLGTTEMSTSYLVREE